jgi:hypothetical protein
VQVFAKRIIKIKAYERDKGDITNLQASWIHFWKRVRKSDGIVKFLQIVDVKLQAPFHHQRMGPPPL